MQAASIRLQEKLQALFLEQVPDRAIRHIILHALEVFSRKGFAGAKIKDIAESAGFSQGYVYTYFKSKDDLFTKIVELASEGAERSVLLAASMGGTPLERITWLTEAYLSPDSMAMQHWRFLLLQSAGTDSVPEEAKRITKERMSKPIEALLPLIIEGQRQGEIVKDEPLMLSIAYFSMIQGLGMARVQTSGNLPFPSAEVVLRFMRAGNQES